MNSKTLLVIIIILVALGLLLYLYRAGKFAKGPIHAQYEQKIRIEQNRKVIYPDFTVIFTGETEASDALGSHPVYNFEISSDQKKSSIAIDMNVGFAGSTQLRYFDFADKKFYLVADSTTQEMFVNYEK